VGVEGEIYPCSGFVGVPSYVVGTIRSDEPTAFGRRVRSLHAWNEKCCECAYLPVCAGGCRLPAYLAGQDVSTTVCDFAFYDRMVPLLVTGYKPEDAAAKENGMYA
jgi:uncharacterized protein